MPIRCAGCASTPPEPSGRSLVDALVERTARVLACNAECARCTAVRRAVRRATSHKSLFRTKLSPCARGAERCVSIIVEFRLYLSCKPSLVTDWCRPPRVPRRPPACRSLPAVPRSIRRLRVHPQCVRQCSTLVSEHGGKSWQSTGPPVAVAVGCGKLGVVGAEPCGWASVVVAGARVIYAQATARPNIVELYPSDWPFAAQHPSSTRHYCVGGIGRPISA